MPPTVNKARRETGRQRVLSTPTTHGHQRLPKKGNTMTAKKQSTKKGGTKGKAEGGKQTVTAAQTVQIEAEAEAFKQAAHNYAMKAYTAAVAHFEKYHADPFALSRLAVVYEEQE